MPKIVQSMLKALGRQPSKAKLDNIDTNSGTSSSGGSGGSSGSRREKAKKGRKSVLDADSFVFLPGDKAANYWGQILNDENFPLSQLSADYSVKAAEMRRRKTHVGGLRRAGTEDSNGVQEVNVIRPRAKTTVNHLQVPGAGDGGGSPLHGNGLVYNRRYSGSLVKRRSTDEVEDAALIHDYAFCVSERDRWSHDLSDQCIYDKLIRPPPPNRTSTPVRNNSPPVQWSYPPNRAPSNKKESPKIREKSQHARSQSVFIIDEKKRNRFAKNEEHLRSSSRQTLASHGYCDLEPPTPRSEYSMPADSVDWEQIRKRMWKDTEEYATVQHGRDGSSPVLGRYLSSKDITLLDKIGEGQFGDVHKGILYPDTNEEEMVAIKTCKPDASNDDRSKFLEEAAVMRQFHHPHIIRLFGVVREQAILIVMELAPLGQLRRYLLTEGSLISKLSLLQYVQQLSSAMVHLESKNYVHRDIAARNVLVSSPEVVKLADFGLSRGLEDTDFYVASRGKLPIKWMAPESINFRRFTGLSDVWMFGVCCWEILMRGVKPFVGIKNDEVINRIENGERLALPPECPASLFRLMNSCWQYDPEDRPTFRELNMAINEVVEDEMQLDALVQRQGGGHLIRVGGGYYEPEPPEKPPRDVPSRSTDIHDNHSLSDDSSRAASRIREFSISPHQDGRASPLQPDLSSPPPPKPVRTSYHAHSHAHANAPAPLPVESGRSEHPPPLPIEPYSITTISRGDSHASRYPNSRSSVTPPLPSAMNSIPPPSIIRGKQPMGINGGSSNAGINGGGGSSGGSDIYYSTPAEMMEHTSSKGPSRILNEDGVFVTRETYNSQSSLESNQGVRPRLEECRPISHVSTGGGSSNHSSVSDERGQPPADDSFEVDPDDAVLKQTTAVVKTVMELSNKVPISRPSEYVDLVRNVGMNLRDLLSKVDLVIQDLPAQTHTEVSMAHKVLSSDMTQLVEAMKNAQKNYQTFLEQDYQKQMLKAAHIVAVNSKQLLDAVNSARRKARLMQR